MVGKSIRDRVNLIKKSRERRQQQLLQQQQQQQGLEERRDSAFASSAFAHPSWPSSSGPGTAGRTKGGGQESEEPSDGDQHIKQHFILSGTTPNMPGIYFSQTFFMRIDLSVINVYIPSYIFIFQKMKALGLPAVNHMQVDRVTILNKGNPTATLNHSLLWHQYIFYTYLHIFLKLEVTRPILCFLSWILFLQSCSPQMVPISESGSVPNLPIGQSVSMSSMSVGQGGGGPAAQTFLKPNTMVPQVSPSVPQQYFQVKMVIILICSCLREIFLHWV